ncbi:presequence translocated-associated motor subunit PAM17 [Aspergillus thermomutatus]|uniref:Presequence translocated-associated motor subunit PAM17 n=1 Tax=Aspergillus thermomutatus TaxID=41047 RepID=A0A397HUP6_ASPTH|nr:TIM23 complex component [Aspergillus thermomutatus]RHZ65708.1 TIM23 complex component [Aspergillus thermomutatus]
MHLTSMNGTFRTVALSGRFALASPSPLPSATPLFQCCQKMSLRTQARPASTSTTRILLKPSNRPQPNVISPSPILRNTAFRLNSTAANAPRIEAAKLDWNSFFKLRASRRRYTLASSIIASMASTIIGVQVLSEQDLESLGAQVMGLDPFVVLGLATAACGAVGWLAGPFLGNAVWGLVYRRYKPAVLRKEKEFYDRIKRFRVDPSSNSIANPVPDYYGEKIGSVQGYRQWLKDQRAYNRKRRSFIL